MNSTLLSKTLDPALPVHPRTGLTALGFRRNGAPIWPVMGAAEDDDDSDDDEQDDDAGKNDDDDLDADDEDAKDLGDAGKKAIDRMKARAKTERDRRKALEQELAALKKKPAKTGDDNAPDLDAVREAAKAEARAEQLSERVADKIEAKAGARFNLDPEDVAALLLRRHDVDDFVDNGRVDTDAIAEALDELLESKPSLAAATADDGKGKRRGGVDQGARGGSRPKQLSREDLKRMSPAEILKAKNEGRLDAALSGGGKR